jgi:mycoredoxin
MAELYTLQPDTITLYGVDWCPDCHRARAVLAEHKVIYIDVDIDKDPRGEAFVKQQNRGFRSVPTIVFPDGSVLIEPPRQVLAEKLALTQTKAA